MIDGWEYYNHALLPLSTPSDTVDVPKEGYKKMWMGWSGIPLFLRWTEKFDCANETNWWYIIKDTPFDINDLKAKRRYEITKGCRYFDVNKICAEEYIQELARVQKKAISQYKGGASKFNKDSFCDYIRREWNKKLVFGAYDKETGTLCGYALLTEREKYVEFTSLKVLPECERLGINAAIVYEILSFYNEKLKNGFYIVDGEKSINHETNFQDYLEKYFMFRKAYCELKILYRPEMKICMKFFRFLEKQGVNFDRFHQVSAVLKMDKIARGEKHE